MGKNKKNILYSNKLKYSQTCYTQPNFRLELKYEFLDYKVYSIISHVTTIGYIGVFSNGKYNFIIIHPDFNKLENEILNFVYEKLSNNKIKLYPNTDL